MKWITTLLDVIGLGLLTAAAALVAVPLGLAVAGASVLAVSRRVVRP